MSKRVLFYRLGAIGDVIHCLPTLKLLKERQPDYGVEFAVGSRQLKDLLEAYCPYIDKVYFLPKNFKSEDLRNAVSGSLGVDCWDEFVYLHSNWFKALYLNAMFFKAKQVKCYKKDTRFEARENFALTYFPELEFKTSQRFDLRYEGEQVIKQYQPENFELLDYQVLETSQQEQNYICVVPGVGSLRPDRALPLPYWEDLIVDILDNSDQEVKILGGPDEETISTELFINLGARFKDSDEKHQRRENLIGKTSLTELVEVLAGAQHVYSGDTGILHIASALGLSTTSIYGITNEARTGPFSPKAKILSSKNCACRAANQNLGNEQKNCKHHKDGYAACMWDCQQNFEPSLIEA